MKINTSIINFLFHLLDKFFNIIAAPSAEGLYSDGKKIQHDLIFFSICGINFSNILAAPSAEGLCLDKKKGKQASTFFSICGTTFQIFLQRLQLKVRL